MTRLVPGLGLGPTFYIGTDLYVCSFGVFVGLAFDARFVLFFNDLLFGMLERRSDAACLT